MSITFNKPPSVAFLTGQFTAENVIKKVTRSGDLSGVFHDIAAWQAIPSDTPIYEVEMLNSLQGEGELYVGMTHLHPGRVGNEFHMTRGHFHQRREQGEVYFGIRGSGLLLLQNEHRKAWLEHVSPGSVHIIPGDTAHRLINTGSEVLSALAVWPSIAGHDYGSLAQGFAARVVLQDGKIQAKEVQNG
ncbi:glucose-6-phosphate isomerase family protein [Buttiauxella selenatireducens]|uniref:glucose-6-phosphate isomerase n=1 Tax=Buttiauxella selenatireducens TaxID=3073902 RepID=A0ABY9SBX3_9ENTR|nr:MULTISPECIES: glucose-6-phosphate isomerase family protein [unclassified Buttiauxella]WMY75014.1 glucose-6-phosphate isomerase family protein [Buttiauxella sp. R73]GDX05414.1 glucose-6-phosphate isomerase [Buttiauxella sp. A111]